MSKQRKKTRRDAAETARSLIEQLTGERMAGGPLPKPEESQEPDTRNPAAVALSKLGASKGGNVRAQNLSKRKRVAIAKKAANTRWGNTKKRG